MLRSVWRNLSVCVVALLVGFLLLCIGCGQDSNSSSSPRTPLTTPPSPTSQALVVGAANGTVLQTIASQYTLVPGTGNEDPTPYAMIIFDGNNTAPARIAGNVGVQNFSRRRQGRGDSQRH